ncbi:MAG TPA: dephospho-CoA kinase [Phycisphaeraceae bacterium]|nr:dephospho-CoA kinase [Phycisphaeraceae bacterium]
MSNGNHKKVFVVGLVGGIGSGKSTVAQAFGRLGCLVLDADQMARELLNQQDVSYRLVQWWGRDILQQDGLVDRSKVAEIVFSDARELQRLEGLIHPLVCEEIEKVINRVKESAADRCCIVVDAPMLLEAGLDRTCDVLVFVDCPREIRLQRVRENRSWESNELLRREKMQLPLAEKRLRSQYVLQNTGDPTEIQLRVEALFNDLKMKHLQS